MNRYKLSDIVIQIAVHSFLKETELSEEQLTKLSEEEMKEVLTYLYKKIDIIGTDNGELRNPLNLDESFFYFRDREIPLTGQEMITGDYLIFDYTGHNEDMYITQFNSINELEEEITGHGGITNQFTTYQIAIVKGKVRQYKVTFINGNDGKEYDFVKDLHHENPVYQNFFDEEERPESQLFKITDVKMHWLD